MGLDVHTRRSLADDLRGFEIVRGDIVMIHAAFGRVGTVLGGPDALLDALLDVVGTSGTVVSYQDWELNVDPWDDDGGIAPELRPHVPPFDPATSRPARDHGIVASTVSTRPGVRRSRNPGASIAALGKHADELTRDHPWNDGYGNGSPLARLVESRAKVVMIGAPWETMTVLHYAEAVADLPNKRRVRYEYPVLSESGSTVCQWVDEFDTSRPVVDGPDDDYFAAIVSDFVTAGGGISGVVGSAETIVVDAAAMVEYAVDWLEARYG